MSFPARDAFEDDPEYTDLRWRVYRALKPPRLSFTKPRALKVEEIQLLARVRRSTAVRVRAWLIQRGYLVQHARGHRGTPIVTLAYALEDDAPRQQHG